MAAPGALDGVEHLVPARQLGPTLVDELERPATELLRPAADAQRPLAHLLGVPFDTTTLLRRGARFGPAAIRQAIAGSLSYDPNWGVDLADAGELADCGDVDVLQTDVAESWRRTAATVAALAGGELPLVVAGGDHGCTFPVLQGLAQAVDGPLGVVALDQHFDVRVSQHGEVSSGVPFRYMLERLDGAVAGRNFVEIGCGGWRNTHAYHEYLREQGAQVVTAREVHRGDVEAIAAAALDRAADGTDGIWLTIDVDAIDAAHMPGCATPAVGGLTAWDALEIVWAHAHHPKALGLDVMEISPPYDPTGVSAQLAAQLILTFLAGRCDAAAAAG